MTRELPRSEILATLASLRSLFPTTRWFGFGSFFHGVGPYGDIDLLALCSEHREAQSVRGALQDLSMSWPIHLIVMMEQEETQTDFVRRQKCRLLLPDATL